MKKTNALFDQRQVIYSSGKDHYKNFMRTRKVFLHDEIVKFKKCKDKNLIVKQNEVQVTNEEILLISFSIVFIQRL